MLLILGLCFSVILSDADSDNYMKDCDNKYAHYWKEQRNGDKSCFPNNRNILLSRRI